MAVFEGVYSVLQECNTEVVAGACDQRVHPGGDELAAAAAAAAPPRRAARHARRLRTSHAALLRIDNGCQPL